MTVLLARCRTADKPYMKVTPKPDRRVAARLEAVFGVHGAVDDGIDVTMINISASGVLLDSPVALEVGSVHAISFQLDGVPPMATVFARVVHITPVLWFHGEGCFAGLEFPPSLAERQDPIIQRLIQVCALDHR